MQWEDIRWAKAPLEAWTSERIFLLLPLHLWDSYNRNHMLIGPDWGGASFEWLFYICVLISSITMETHFNKKQKEVDLFLEGYNRQTYASLGAKPPWSFDWWLWTASIYLTLKGISTVNSIEVNCLSLPLPLYCSIPYMLSLLDVIIRLSDNVG